MTYLMHALSERYAQMGEEVRTQAIAEIMSFQRNGQERIEDLLTRFAQYGQTDISVQGLTWILIKACGVSDQQFLTLMRPTAGLMPAMDAEFTALRTQLRRMCRILERAPGNLASHLRGGGPAARAFMAGPIGDSWSGTTGDPWQQGLQESQFYNPQGPPAYTAMQAPAWPDPWANCSGTASSSTHQNPAVAYFSIEGDSGTVSDTASSLGDTTYDTGFDTRNMSLSQIGDLLFWAYQKSKGAWRKFTGKPVRAVRRFVR